MDDSEHHPGSPAPSIGRRIEDAIARSERVIASSKAAIERSRQLIAAAAAAHEESDAPADDAARRRSERGDANGR